MGEVPRLDLGRLIAELRNSSVRYVAIGGIAALALDLPVPATVDLDITPMRSRENYKHLSDFFRVTDTKLFTSQDGGTWFPHQLIDNWSQYDTLHLLTKFGLLDIVFSPEGAPHGYRQLFKNSLIANLGSESFRSISEQQWVALKHATGRDKDLEHLALYYQQRKNSES